MLSEADKLTIKHWLMVIVPTFVVGAGDYLINNPSGDWHQSVTAALAAGGLAAWAVLKKALLTPPPSE